jgi:hypothetical protein
VHPSQRSLVGEHLQRCIGVGNLLCRSRCMSVFIQSPPLGRGRAHVCIDHHSKSRLSIDVDRDCRIVPGIACREIAWDAEPSVKPFFHMRAAGAPISHPSRRL